jgi:hypothetical protein
MKDNPDSKDDGYVLIPLKDIQVALQVDCWGTIKIFHSETGVLAFPVKKQKEIDNAAL